MKNLRRRVPATLVSLALIITAAAGFAAEQSSAASAQVTSATSSSAYDGKHDPNTYYLALGDSLAAGIQADGTTGQGYADQFIATYGAATHLTALHDLGCSGEHLKSFWAGTCGRATSPQLRRAEDFIVNQNAVTTASAERKVGLISISVGANDLLDLVRQCLTPPTSLDWNCVTANWPATKAKFQTDFRNLVNRLQNWRTWALSYPVDIALMNLYNPFVALLPDAAQRAASDHMVNELNAFIKSLVPNASAGSSWFRLSLVDAFGAINGQAGGPSEQSNVAKYTSIATGDPHPTTAGYQQLAAALFQALPTS